MRSRATYREFAPAPDLQSYVACYWTSRVENYLEPGDLLAATAVLPDACMDFLFDFSGGDSILVGAMTRPLIVPDHEGSDIMGVRFRPGGLSAVVSLAADEITDGVAPLTAVWNVLASETTERLRESATTRARITILDRALRRSIEQRRGDDRLIRNAAHMVEQLAGAADARALAELTGLGRRQFERRFRGVVGLPVRTARRIVRFQRSISLLRQRPPLPLTEIALDAGYHDQAHFNRDFREFAGTSPGEYRRIRIPDVAPVQDRAGYTG